MRLGIEVFILVKFFNLEIGLYWGKDFFKILKYVN